MKWPNSVTLVRHAESEYNALRRKKADDPLYQEFLKTYAWDFQSAKCRDLANQVWKRYALNTSDYGTRVSDAGHKQAWTTGFALAKESQHKPDVVLVSPYNRTRQTWEIIQDGGFDAGDARVIYEDRVREQEHGLSLVYSDWRVFHAFHPEQKLLRDLQGPYWYQYPQGESVSMVRDRTRDVISMMIREFSGLNVWIITHHLTILSVRANLERLSPEEFIHLDENEKPKNVGITQYIGDPRSGKDGRLVLKEYNKTHY